MGFSLVDAGSRLLFLLWPVPGGRIKERERNINAILSLKLEV